MKYTSLGDTGINVSALCFGTLTIGPLQQNLPLNIGAGLLELAYDSGINFFDTAELYGTYPYIKQALSRYKEAVICTKSYAYDKKTAEESLTGAMKGMGREYIDIFLFHEQESEHTIRGHYEAIEYLLQKKKEGCIGAVGLSTHYIAGVRGANKYPELSIVFPLINYTGIGIADGGADEMMREIDIAHAKGKGVIAMKSLGGGHLIPQREKAFQYLFNQNSIDTIAVGMQSIAEIQYNCALFSGEIPDDLHVKSISNQKRTLHIHDWCEGCGACVKRCKNGALSLEDEKAVVNTNKCALCGYCARECPQFCIKVI